MASVSHGGSRKAAARRSVPPAKPHGRARAGVCLCLTGAREKRPRGTTGTVAKKIVFYVKLSHENVPVGNVRRKNGTHGSLHTGQEKTEKRGQARIGLGTGPV